MRFYCIILFDAADAYAAHLSLSLLFTLSLTFASLPLDGLIVAGSR